MATNELQFLLIQYVAITTNDICLNIDNRSTVNTSVFYYGAVIR